MALTSIGWTFTPVPQGIKCPFCKGTGWVKPPKKKVKAATAGDEPREAVKPVELVMCDFCSATGTAYQLPGYTFNSWTGCVEIGRGCVICYAKVLSNRWRGTTLPSLWGKDAPRQLASETYWQNPEKWNEYARENNVRLKVFCLSMGDIFEDRRDLDASRERLWQQIEATPYLDWLLLTKRPGKMCRLLPERWRKKNGGHAPRNVWFGCTICENKELHTVYKGFQKFVESDYDPNVIFLSLEPLVNDLVDLEAVLTNGRIPDWLIVGGESGQTISPVHPNWIKRIHRFCAEFSASFFFKQWGTWAPMVPEEGSNIASLRLCAKTAEVTMLPAQADAHNCEHDIVFYRHGKGAAGNVFKGKQYTEFPTPQYQVEA